MHSQNTKTEDEEINKYPRNIFPTIEISNGMFGENLTLKDLMER
jgi:hypothetical protein